MAWLITPRARFVLRVVAIFIGLIFIFMGGLALNDWMKHSTLAFDSTVKFSIAAIGWGIVTIVVAIRGRLFKHTGSKQ